MSTIKRKELVHEVAQLGNMSDEEALVALNSLITVIREHLLTGDRIIVPGLCTVETALRLPKTVTTAFGKKRVNSYTLKKRVSARITPTTALTTFLSNHQEQLLANYDEETESGEEQ